MSRVGIFNTLRRASTLSRRAIPLDINSEKIISPEARLFLRESRSAKYNFSAASTFPRSILGAPTNVRGSYDEFEEEKGQSLGDPQVRRNFEKYLERRGIILDHEKTSISIMPSIIDTLKDLAGIGALGSEILMVPPFYGYIVDVLQSFGVKTISLKNYDEKNIATEINDALMTHRKVDSILMCDPATPNGKIIEEKTAKEIAEKVNKHANGNILMVFDGAFSHPLHHPFNALKAGFKNHITICSFYKSIPTRRHAFCVGSTQTVGLLTRMGGYDIPSDDLNRILGEGPEIHEYFTRAAELFSINKQLIDQKILALNEEFGKIFGEKRNYIEPLEDNLPGVYNLSFKGLEGKTYNGKPLRTGLDIANFLLKESSIATVPDECYGIEENKMQVRFTINEPKEKISNAFDSIISAAKKIQNNPSKQPSPKGTVVTLENVSNPSKGSERQ